MHSTQTQNKFIELRAQGWSLRRIADQIQISTKTSLKWSKDFHDQIEELKFSQFQAMKKHMLEKTQAHIDFFTEHIGLMKEELKLRHPGALKTHQLYHTLVMFQRELRHTFTSILALRPTPKPEDRKKATI